MLNSNNVITKLFFDSYFRDTKHYKLCVNCDVDLDNMTFDVIKCTYIKHMQTRSVITGQIQLLTLPQQVTWKNSENKTNYPMYSNKHVVHMLQCVIVMCIIRVKIHRKKNTSQDRIFYLHVASIVTLALDIWLSGNMWNIIRIEENRIIERQHLWLNKHSEIWLCHDILLGREQESCKLSSKPKYLLYVNWIIWHCDNVMVHHSTVQTRPVLTGLIPPPPGNNNPLIMDNDSVITREKLWHMTHPTVICNNCVQYFKIRSNIVK